VLFLQRPDSTEIEAAHASGRNAERFKGRRIASGAGITGWVVANRHPMHNCDPRSISMFSESTGSTSIAAHLSCP
jgi:hypothetical protein